MFEPGITLHSAVTYVLGLFILGLLTLKLLWKPKYYPPGISKTFSLRFAGEYSLPEFA
jgi:hypothetical protein